MSKLIETTTAQKIFKSMIDLNLDKDEVIYFEEFINLLYEAGLLNPDFQEHQEFIENNRNYFIELRRIRIEGNKTLSEWYVCWTKKVKQGFRLYI